MKNLNELNTEIERNTTDGENKIGSIEVGKVMKGFRAVLAKDPIGTIRVLLNGLENDTK